MGIGGDGQFALFVAQFFIVVVVNRHVLMEVIVFSYGFGISQRCLRLLVHPTFKFVAHFIGPIKTFEGLPFHAEGVGVFAIDDGALGEDRHANKACVYRAVVNSIFEDFSGLVGVVGHFSS